jgi:hypothetical protein
MLPDREGLPSKVHFTQEFEDEDLPPHPETSIRNANAAANLVDARMREGRSYPHFKVQKPLFHWEGRGPLTTERVGRRRTYDDSVGDGGGDGDGDDGDGGGDGGDGNGKRVRYPAKKSKFDHPFIIEACEPGATRDAKETWRSMKTWVGSHTT